MAYLEGLFDGSVLGEAEGRGMGLRLGLDVGLLVILNGCDVGLLVG